MRILHLVHQYLPDYVGGTELYTQALATALADREHEIAIFYRRSQLGQGETSRVDGDIRVWCAWDGAVTPLRRFAATFYAPALAPAFERVLDTFEPDLIHLQHLMGLPAHLLDLIVRRSIPFVVTLHDYWWICANAQLLTNYSQQICDGPRAYMNCARCALARAGHTTMRWAVPFLAPLLAWRNARLRRGMVNAACMISPTEFVKAWYVAHGLPGENVHVIPHGIQAPRVQRAPRETEAVHFAYIGGLSWQKGVHIVVKAFCELLHMYENSPKPQLWIAGDLNSDPDYVNMLRALVDGTAAQNVRFLGKLDRAAVWDTLARVDAVVVPSLWYETFSLIVREAFVAGVPVLVSDLGALAESVRDDVDGLRIPPGDVQAWYAAMHRYVANRDLRRVLRSDLPVPLTLDAHVDRIEAVYARVVAPSTRTEV